MQQLFNYPFKRNPNEIIHVNNPQYIKISINNHILKSKRKINSKKILKLKPLHNI